jgi:putative DNA methylase
MMIQAFMEARRVLKPGAPLVCIHPYTSTGELPTLTDALQQAGFVLIETWKLSTEIRSYAHTPEEESLPSTIILVAR